MARGIRRDEEPLLIRNYDVLPISVLYSYRFIFNYLIQPIGNRCQYKTIDDFNPQPMKTLDNYSTLPSKVPIHIQNDNEFILSCSGLLQLHHKASVDQPRSPSSPFFFLFSSSLSLSSCPNSSSHTVIHFPSLTLECGMQ